MHAKGNTELSSVLTQSQTLITTDSAAGLRWVLLMLQHWAQSRNRRPTATDEKTRKVFSISVVISLVGTISGNIIKIAATRCHILKLKCTKFDFGCGSAQDPAGGAYCALPQIPSTWI